MTIFTVVFIAVIINIINTITINIIIFVIVVVVVAAAAAVVVAPLPPSFFLCLSPPQARNKTIQESAVETLHRLAEGNTHVQNDVLERGAERLLMQLLKKRNAESLQEKTAMALWALAGDDINEKKEMANGIGVQTLIEFTNSQSENLHMIGSEGLGVLAQVGVGGRVGGWGGVDRGREAGRGEGSG